jgi:hypothetical protein
LADWLALTQEAFDASSAYVDANYRPDWDYSLRAFRNEHASGSKYLSDEYKSRSRLFPPHTRSIIRKNEAAGAAALFSNMDVVNLTPGNPDDAMSVASAEAMKAVLEYRLTHSIPAFQVCLGGLQDAQTIGSVVSYQYWEYQKKGDKKIKDKPCIDLRPIENIRLDGGASWLDPVNTSPYFCDIIPMYVCDVKAMMASEDKEGNKWKTFEDSVILQARPDVFDSTRKARLGNKQDPQDETTGIKSFDIVWVMRWFMRDSQGDDFTYYSLGTEDLLTEPKPIEEVYFHGKRPYVMGYCVLETHKAMKTGLPMLTKPLQQESADITNQRLDNVKFVLNKRWLVARGRQVDVQSLVRNVPGGVTLTTDPNTDVKESNWPDVTSSAFVEHDRIKSQFDELAGSFSPSTRVANNAVNDTLGGSKMANMSAGIMTDYLLRTFIETWWEPVLRQLVMLEQYYETDDVILGICAQKARLFPKFGISRITDMMLMNEVNLVVNVGMGSSDPNTRLQKFVFAIKLVIEMIQTAPPGVNVQEIAKEIFSMAGYRDGARFISQQADPRLLQAMQGLQQMKAMLEGKQMELQATGQVEQMKIQSNERIKGAQLQVDQARIGGDLQIRQSELAVEEQRLQLEFAKLELEKLRIQMEAAQADQDISLRQADRGSAAELANLKLEQERQKLSGLVMKIAGDVQKASLELETARSEQQNEARIGEVANQVSTSMQGVSQELEAIKTGLGEARAALGEIESLKSDMRNVGQGLVAVAGSVVKKKPKGFRLKKDGPKTTGVEVNYDDGTFEEIAVS